MPGNTDDILREVADYYSGKIARYGETPQGVDWNGEEGQRLRFTQLSQVLPGGASYSVNDLGCGYGSFFDFLLERGASMSYLGIDVSEAMIAAAQRRCSGHANARFIVGPAPDAAADYGIASGIFNVRQGRSNPEWEAYVGSTLDLLNATSRLGFAFNCLTSYSDPDRMRPDLYYADPCKLFDMCKRRYSRNVALLHDYGLYEFTILVRR